MSNELIIMSMPDGFEATYPRIDLASIAARQCVMRTGEPVTIRVYEVSGETKVLRRRVRVLKRLDGTIGVGAA